MQAHMTADPGDALASASSIYVMYVDAATSAATLVSPGAVSGREFFNWDCSACSSGPYLLRSRDVALSQDGGGAISLGLLTLYASVGDLISEPMKYIWAREMFCLLSIHSVDSVL